MNIGFIGAGRVGCSLGRYFIHNGFLISGYYSRSYESACLAAELTETKPYENLLELVSDCDVIFVTVNDGAIVDVGRQLATYNLKDKILCHCSGAMSSAVFEDLEGVGGIGSLHPLMAISSKEQALGQAFFTIEGNDIGIKVLRDILTKCKNPYQTIDSGNKTKYHLAAATASNLVVGLLDMSVSMLTECGFSEEAARKALSPLVVGNAKAVMDVGAKEALTGPVSRGDCETVVKHLDNLEGEEAIIYKLLSKRLLKLSTYSELSRVDEMKGILEE